MHNTISFMSANYVARQVNYQMTEGWMQGDTATNAYFRPLDTFAARFEEIVRDIHALGFAAMDIWTAHLNPTWATPEHVAQAQHALAQYNMAVASLAGYFGDTADDVRASCELAAHLGAPVLGGNTGLLETDRPQLVAILKDYGIRLGIENHPEKTPQELMAKMGESEDGFIGAAIDTGWWGTHGYDAAQAIDALGHRTVHVHLKDILTPEPTNPPGATMKSIGHETCALGKGVVPIHACIGSLHTLGYTGALSIEHEPEDFDPNEDVKESLALLRQWLGAF